MNDTLQHVALVVTTIVAASGAYFAGTRNRREDSAERRADVDAVIRIKDEMIEALKDDREQLKCQLAESQKRERDLAGEVKELKKQLRDLERETRRTVTAILEAMADSERCLRASRGCKDFEPPGDRRKATEIKAGGTD